MIPTAWLQPLEHLHKHQTQYREHISIFTPHRLVNWKPTSRPGSSALPKSSRKPSQRVRPYWHKAVKGIAWTLERLSVELTDSSSEFTQWNAETRRASPLTCWHPLRFQAAASDAEVNLAVVALVRQQQTLSTGRWDVLQISQMWPSSNMKKPNLAR